MKEVTLLGYEGIENNVILRCLDDEGTLILYVCLQSELEDTEDVRAAVEERLMRTMESLGRIGRPFHLLLDSTESPPLSLQRARRLHDILVQDRQMLSLCLHSTIILSNNNLFNALLNSIFTLFPPTRPLHFLPGKLGDKETVDAVVAFFRAHRRGDGTEV